MSPIQQLRTELGATSGMLARLVGVPDRTVQRWIAGDREPPESALRLLELCRRPYVRALVEAMADGRSIT